MAHLVIGTTTIELHADGTTVTVFADGVSVPALPDDTDYQRASANSLGYDGDICRASRDHEIGHTLLAQLLGLDCSPTLRGVADGSYWKHWRDEEAAVLALQRYARSAGVDLVAIAEQVSASTRGCH